MLVTVNARLAVFQQIDLVVNPQLRHIGGFNFSQHFVHFVNIVVAFRGGAIHHVHQQVGFSGFLQGCLKRFHQLVRQVTNKAYGVGQDHFTNWLHRQPTQGRVQCCKQLVGGVHLGAGKSIEQGRLAGVGVAHDGDSRRR